MSEYQLELKQIVDYPRCRIYRQFIGLLMKDKSIRVGGTSGLYHFTVLSCFANFRTSYKRIDGISYTIYPGEWLCRVSELTEWFRTRFQHQALAILRELQDRHLITYTLLGRGRLVKFKIKGWCKYNRVLEYNAPCQKDTGFFFLPISVANELVSAGRCSEMDAMLDLWINTVYNDTQVQGSEVGPVVYMRNGTGSPLIGYAELAQRWGVSKATAGRYLRKMQELDYLSMVAFPGTHGTAIYLKQYLSTMFQISDVMIDKDEVAMSLNIACRMRHLLYGSTATRKETYLASAGVVQGIRIKAQENMLEITLPCLLPKRKQRQSTEFLIDPLYFTLSQYSDNNELPKFRQCVVCFSHIYSEKFHNRRVRDYDNLELKQLLDVLSTFIMVDDTGLLVDAYNTTEIGEADCTRISVMAKEDFPKWLNEREKSLKTISDF